MKKIKELKELLLSIDDKDLTWNDVKMDVINQVNNLLENLKTSEKLKFKKDAEPMAISEDFFYMINGGGWMKPENYLEDDDANKVREAIDIINQYEQQGIEEGFFDEM